MEELQEFLLTEELLIVYAIVGVIMVIGIVFLIARKTYNGRKRKQNTKELNRLVDEVQERLEEDKNNLEVNKLVEEEKLEPVPEVSALKTDNKVVYNEPVHEDVQVLDLHLADVNAPKEEVLTPQIEKLEVEEPVVPEPVATENITFYKPSGEVLAPKEELKANDDIEILDVDSIVEQLDEIEVLDVEEPAVKQPVATISEEKKFVKPKQVEELQYEDANMNQTQAQKEIEKLTRELVQANDTLENIDLTDFEEEQEKNAIISLDEFLKLGDQLYDKNEVTQYEDEGNEPISLADLEAQRAKEVETTTIAVKEPVHEVAIQQTKEENNRQSIKLDDLNTIKETSRANYSDEIKFQRSPIISPVYGIEKTVSSNDMELENTANYEKLDEEIRKTNEFLSTLRELQDKL